jgi:hypothetical protein
MSPTFQVSNGRCIFPLVENPGFTTGVYD